MDYVFNVLVINPQITTSDYINKLISPLIPNIKVPEIATLFQDIPYSFDYSLNNDRLNIQIIGQSILAQDFFQRQNLLQFQPSAMLLLLPKEQSLQSTLCTALRSLPHELKSVTRMVPISAIVVSQNIEIISSLSKLLHDYQIQIAVSNEKTLEGLIKFLVQQSKKVKDDIISNLGADYSMQYAWVRGEKKSCHGQ